MKLAWLALFVGTQAFAGPCGGQSAFRLVIHGGAGNWNVSPGHKAKVTQAAEDLLREGAGKLQGGERALDVVQLAVMRMEDSGLFNAGKGSVRNTDGEVEMDASIMDGRNLKAGAVAAVKTVKNAVRGARLVMDTTWHVMVSGQGADKLAKDGGLATVGPDYFTGSEPAVWDKYGTVGAVAWDRCGDLSAATSTGGLRNKLPGRIGDSPIIGAGTYAKNGVVAVSGTGQGEYFIRLGVAREVAALIEYRRMSLVSATDEVVWRQLKALGGQGGVIAVDARGNIATPYNTPGMFRGFVTETGNPAIAF